MTAELSPVQLRTSLGPGEWSANEVLAHLRSCADVWGDSIAAILAQDHPALRAISPRTWMRKTDYLEREFRPSLEAFAVQRAALVAVLQPLTPADWSRLATVKAAGRTLERSLLFYVQSLVTHEQPHIKQIGRVAEGLHAKWRKEKK
ncbi:MAG: DinB family protein [Caldilineaceae bacterium]|nr:DinB family protein [Caldilineaceae bacterium]